jgi:hypothetical protein
MRKPFRVTEAMRSRDRITAALFLSAPLSAQRSQLALKQRKRVTNGSGLFHKDDKFD